MLDPEQESEVPLEIVRRIYTTQQQVWKRVQQLVQDRDHWRQLALDLAAELRTLRGAS